MSALINLNNNGHINSINFNTPLLAETCIMGMKNWDQIPKVSIITGKNGMGKTSILNYIRSYIKDNKLKTELLFPNDNYILSQENRTDHYSSSYYSICSIDDLFKYSKKLITLNNENNKSQLINVIQKVNSDTDITHYTDVVLETIKNKPENQQDELINIEIKKIINNNKNNDLENKFSKFICLLKKIKTERQSFIDSFGRNDLAKETENLLKFYNLSSKYENKSYEDFFKRFTSKSKEIIGDYVDSLLNTNNVNELFGDLEKNGFRIIEEDNDFHIEKKTYRGVYERITTRSTGEIYILHLFALKYDINNMRAKKPNIIIFDEPDKSWDPDYIRIFLDIIFAFHLKNNIQIILTTHKIDTVKLAGIHYSNDISVYSIRNKGVTNQKQVIKCHPLLATFRLTSDRELINVKTRVYVEALTDSFFYSNYYQSLCNLCQVLRGSITKKILNNRLMSRRFQMQFFSCANNKSGGGGGCDQMIYAVQRDKNTVNEENNELKFLPSKLSISFGLIDLDNSNDNFKKINKENLLDRICILNRHSLENFLYDPFILFFNQTRDQKRINLIKKCENSDFKEICCNIFNIPVSELGKLSIINSDLFDSYFKSLLQYLLETSKDKNKNSFKIYNLLREKVDCLKDCAKFENTKSLKPKDFDEMLKHYYKTKKNIDLVDVNCSNRVDLLLGIRNKIIYVSSNAINFDVETIEYNYPIVFLYFHGHTVEETFIQLLNMKNEDKKHLDQTFFNSNIYDIKLMPQDLLKTYFKLNEWVVDQANEIIKNKPKISAIKFSNLINQMEVDEIQVSSQIPYDNLRHSERSKKKRN